MLLHGPALSSVFSFSLVVTVCHLKHSAMSRFGNWMSISFFTFCGLTLQIDASGEPMGRQMLSGDRNCMQFTLDRCEVPQGSLLATVSHYALTSGACQFLCKVTYAKDCDFYILNKEKDSCQGKDPVRKRQRCCSAAVVHF